MKCKLCQQEKKLCDSHIIPEFFYRPIYDNKHKAIYSDLTTLKDKTIQKGLVQKLLCENCETEISKFEAHVENIWYTKQKFPFEFKNDIEVIENIDYAKFKLFHLSVLWKAGISILEDFLNVNLGEHEEIIRRMIYDKNPGNENEYPFYAYALVDKGRVFDRIILQPEEVSIFGHKAYIFIYGGCSWLYIVTNNYSNKNAVFSIRKDGKFAIAKTEIQQNRTIMETLRRMFGKEQ